MARSCPSARFWEVSKRLVQVRECLVVFFHHTIQAWDSSTNGVLNRTPLPSGLLPFTVPSSLQPSHDAVSASPSIPRGAQNLISRSNLCSFSSAYLFCNHSAQRFARHTDLSEHRAAYNAVPPRSSPSPLSPSRWPTRAPKGSRMPLLLYASTCASKICPRECHPCSAFCRLRALRIQIFQTRTTIFLRAVSPAASFTSRRLSFALPSPNATSARKVPSFALLTPW